MAIQIQGSFGIASSHHGNLPGGFHRSVALQAKNRKSLPIFMDIRPAVSQRGTFLQHHVVISLATVDIQRGIILHRQHLLRCGSIIIAKGQPIRGSRSGIYQRGAGKYGNIPRKACAIRGSHRFAVLVRGQIQPGGTQLPAKLQQLIPRLRLVVHLGALIRQAHLPQQGGIRQAQLRMAPHGNSLAGLRAALLILRQRHQGKQIQPLAETQRGIIPHLHRGSHGIHIERHIRPAGHGEQSAHAQTAAAGNLIISPIQRCRIINQLI